jgi:DNA ligase (NAD+)
MNFGVICIVGGIAGGTVNKSTDLVVVGQDAGTKLAKAMELKLECWTEAQWRDLLQVNKIEI